MILSSQNFKTRCPCGTPQCLDNLFPIAEYSPVLYIYTHVNGFTADTL